MPKTPDETTAKQAPKQPVKTPPKSFAPDTKGKVNPHAGHGGPKGGKQPKQRIIRHQGR